MGRPALDKSITRSGPNAHLHLGPLKVETCSIPADACWVNGHGCRSNASGPSEGRACRVRCTTFYYPFHFSGHNKRAPPIVRLEGPACQVRYVMFDDAFWFSGHDRHAPPILSLGGTRRAGPSRKSIGVSTFRPSNYKDMPPEMVSRQTGLSAVFS